MTDPDTNFTTETEFAYCNVGYGVTSFEPGDDFVEFRDGNLFTKTFDSMDGMTWHKGRWQFDSGLGLCTFIVRKEDMTSQQIDECYEQV